MLVMWTAYLFYIGSGLKDRRHHCTSGRSHVSELNTDLCEGRNVYTEVLRDKLSKGVSISIERELIKKFLPIYNKTHNAYASRDYVKNKVA